MGKQYHFVIQYDTDNNEFSIDIDSLYARFADGFIYDTQAQEWAGTMGENLDYLAKERLLADWLEACNREVF